MGKILHNGNWKKEKGMTLVEVIVSLSIILIISAAAVSVAVFTSNSLGTSQSKRFFKNEIENIASIYIEYYEETDESIFLDKFEDYLGKDISSLDEHSIIYYSSSYEVLDNSEDYGYRLNLDFSTNRLDLSSFSSGDKLIYSKEVIK